METYRFNVNLFLVSKMPLISASGILESMDRKQEICHKKQWFKVHLDYCLPVKTVLNVYANDLGTIIWKIAKHYQACSKAETLHTHYFYELFMEEITINGDKIEVFIGS